MELRAATAQLYLINGNPQAGAVPGLMVSPPPPRTARGRQKDTLYLHLTLGGPAAETEVLAQDLLDSISSRFYRTPGSVTASLRKAIVETNEILLRRNLSGTEASREGALICAVQRNDELFMAQVGESFAIMGHNFGVEKMPAETPQRITPMGRTAGLDIRFYHNWLEPTDTLLLADPRIAHLPIESVESALVDTSVQGGIDALQAQLVADTARLMFIEFTDEEPFEMPTEITGTTESGEQLPLPTTGPQREIPTRRANPIKIPNIPIGDTARQAGSQAVMGMGKATGWVANLMATLRPSPDEPPEEPETYLYATLWAIFIPLFVTITIVSSYLSFGETQNISALRQQMNEAMTTASLAETDDERLVAYNRIVALANDADDLRRDDPEVNRLRREALLGLDRLEGITRLKGQILFEYEPGTILSSIAIREDIPGEIYVLDETTNQVWLHRTNEDYSALTTPDPERILQGNQAVGGRSVGTILDLRWFPNDANNPTPGIAMLDGLGTLIDYDSTLRAYTAVPLGLSSEWGIPLGFTFFNERLYLLDAGTNNLWRYFPQVNGFELQGGQEVVAFDSPDTVDGAIDADIYSEDGNIVLLYNDGGLRRYAGVNKLWDEQDLAARGLKSPFIEPTAVHIVGRGTVSSIFVADPALERVVQVALGGNYLAQFKATDESGRELFAGVQDFIVTENPLRIIAIADNKLIIASQ